MVQTVVPDKRLVFHNDNAPIHACGIVRDWFYEHKDELGHLI